MWQREIPQKRVYKQIMDPFHPLKSYWTWEDSFTFYPSKHINKIVTFPLSEIVNDVLIIIPNRVASKCFHFSDCRAYIIIRNDNMVVGNSKCYDMLSGHYWHDQDVNFVENFQIKNMKSKGIVCDYTALDNLIQPVALYHIEDFGNQFTAKIKDQLDILQDAVTNQVNAISIKSINLSPAIIHRS